MYYICESPFKVSSSSSSASSSLLASIVKHAWSDGCPRQRCSTLPSSLFCPQLSSLLYCPPALMPLSYVTRHAVIPLHHPLTILSTHRFVGPRVPVRDLEGGLDFQPRKRVERKTESRNAHGTTDKMRFFHQKTGAGLKKKSQEEMRERTRSQSE